MGRSQHPLVQHFPEFRPDAEAFLKSRGLETSSVLFPPGPCACFLESVAVPDGSRVFVDVTVLRVLRFEESLDHLGRPSATSEVSERGSRKVRACLSWGLYYSDKHHDQK